MAVTQRFPFSQYDYSVVAPSQWTPSLRNRRNLGINRLRVPVRWGAHESVRGVPDFSRGSRIRLEKFLMEANEVGVQLDIVLGFPGGENTLPSWTMALPLKESIPSNLWFGRGSGYELVPIPSFANPELKTGFFDFAREFVSIASLYAGVDGPVKSVSFDPGIYLCSLDAMEFYDFSVPMQKRYGEIRAVNFTYNANFRDFHAFSAQKGFRVLCDKRPWLAAFDYKWCYREILQKYHEEFASLLTGQEFEIPNAAAPAFPSKDWEIAVDGTLLGEGGEGFPLNIGGKVFAATATTFSLYSQLKTSRHLNGEHLCVIPVLTDQKELNAKRTAVVAGKYLPRKSFLLLKAHLENGGEVYFPNGVPQFDEMISTLHWELSPPETILSSDGTRLLKAKCGEGRVWSPLPVIPYGNEFVTTMISHLEKLGWTTE